MIILLSLPAISFHFFSSVGASHSQTPDPDNLIVSSLPETSLEVTPANPAERRKIVEFGTVNVNKADRAKLETLPSISTNIAGEIIQYRQRHSKFSSYDDLTEVSGIGPTTVKLLENKITFGEYSRRHAQDGPVNLNQASVKDLQTLPGIGQTTAKRIIEYRRNHGRFETLSDLENVDGIGRKRVRFLSDRVSGIEKNIDIRDTGNEKNQAININTASVRELQRLNGIGEATAKKIVEYRRAEQYFGSLDDLQNVTGIGSETIQGLQDKATVY